MIFARIDNLFGLRVQYADALGRGIDARHGVDVGANSAVVRFGVLDFAIELSVVFHFCIPLLWPFGLFFVYIIQVLATKYNSQNAQTFGKFSTAFCAKSQKPRDC